MKMISVQDDIEVFAQGFFDPVEDDRGRRLRKPDIERGVAVVQRARGVRSLVCGGDDRLFGEDSVEGVDEGECAPALADEAGD